MFTAHKLELQGHCYFPHVVASLCSKIEKHIKVNESLCHFSELTMSAISLIILFHSELCFMGKYWLQATPPDHQAASSLSLWHSSTLHRVIFPFVRQRKLRGGQLNEPFNLLKSCTRKNPEGNWGETSFQLMQQQTTSSVSLLSDKYVDKRNRGHKLWGSDGEKRTKSERNHGKWTEREREGSGGLCDSETRQENCLSLSPTLCPVINDLWLQGGCKQRAHQPALLWDNLHPTAIFFTKHQLTRPILHYKSGLPDPLASVCGHDQKSRSDAWWKSEQ